MKKENIFKYLYAISILLMIGFIISTWIDWIEYHKGINSAPFSVFIMVNIIELVIPSIVIFIIAKIIKKKYSK